MIVKELVEKIKKDFNEYTFTTELQGAGWIRVFILFKGVSLGRINFIPFKENINEHKIYRIKHYKPQEYEYEKEDNIFYQFYTWLETGKRVKIDHLVALAKKNKKFKVDIIIQWRKENPPSKIRNTDKKRSRPKIHTNWMNEFRLLVINEMRGKEIEKWCCGNCNNWSTVYDKRKEGDKGCILTLNPILSRDSYQIHDNGCIHHSKLKLIKE